MNVARGTLRTCPKCQAKHTRSHRYCLDCHAAYMRAWRPDHPPTAEQRRKSNARSYAHSYRDRGKILRLPCERCGSDEAEMHHEDYDRPIDVTWLCRPCHLAEHAAQ